MFGQSHKMIFERTAVGKQSLLQSSLLHVVVDYRFICVEHSRTAEFI